MLSPELRATIDRINAWQRWHLRDMIAPWRRPLRYYFGFTCEFPTIGPFRSVYVRFVLPGLLIDYRENAEDFMTLRIMTGCGIFLFNPRQLRGENAIMRGRWIVDAFRETEEPVRW
jgi:hypothetical protein